MRASDVDITVVDGIPLKLKYKAGTIIAPPPIPRNVERNPTMHPIPKINPIVIINIIKSYMLIVTLF